MTRLLLPTLLALALAGCCAEEEPASVPVVTLRFDSGGAGHIQGFGAWRVEATRAGTFGVVHQVRDEAKEYGTVDLTPDEVKALWAAVDGARLGELAVPERPGVPDESQLTFALQTEGQAPVEVVVWQNDVSNHAALAPLLDALRTLIETHHDVKPVF